MASVGPPGAAPPPSERHAAARGHRGVGVFRIAGWGWAVTIALALLVGIVIVVGYLRDDPGRNPAPAGYAPAVCAAASELAAGTAALESGVERRAPDVARVVEERVDGAVDALTDLPEWIPGRALDELLGAQIITLTNGAAALAADDDRVADDARAAAEIDREIAAQLDGRYGFDC